ncbi:phage portal protein [Amycolatopsis sp. NPDC051373]|uniref:phage portal protein n=1 Tax=Amycolatopsis sp. NPDC051373 TaxID=3155801 RepID=UPI00344BC83E
MAALLEDDKRPTNQDLDNALAAMRTASPGYDKAEKKYEGNAPEVFASPRMRRAMRQSGINYQLNFDAIVVDSVADRCEIASITANDGDKDSPDADAVIQAVFEANKLELQAPNTMRKASTFGDAYIIVWPRDGAKETDGKYKPEDIALYYQDPRTVRVFYKASNPNEIDYVIKKWEIAGNKVRVDLYYDDRVESYVSKGKTKGKRAADFEPTTGTNADDSDQDADDDNPAPVTPHSFGRPPVFHFKTDADQYGKPEHKGFYPVSDILHKLAVGHMAGVDYQAFPQRYALLDPESDTSEAARLDEGLFSFGMQQGGTTEDYGMEGRSQFRADPGSIWMQKGIKDFGQFDPADPHNFTDPAEFYLRCGATITNTPLHYFDPSGDVPSGESLKTAEAPFVKKVKTRIASFGDTWREIFQFALKLCGYPDMKVTVRWEPVESNDDASTWANTQSKQASGVPVKQTLMEAGYTESQVDEWEDERESGLPQKAELLLQVAEAVAAFATGVTAGVISMEQVNGIITHLIGDVTNDEPGTAPTADPAESGTDLAPRQGSASSGSSADSGDSGPFGRQRRTSRGNGETPMAA